MERVLEREKQLLPNRHPQKELFLCDLGDVALKDDTASMEHPIFSLSKTPDTKIRNYTHKDINLEVIPSVKGLATIWDKDILIFAISQLMAAKKRGEPISQYLEFNAKDFLVFSNRYTGGKNYELLRDSLIRLQGTQLRTTIKTGATTTEYGFSLIESTKVKWKSDNGRILQWGVKLSDWLYRAIESDEVLTLHPEYFRLKSSLERRVYEIARKHCGHQKKWKIGLALLQKKCGSQTPLRSFRLQVKKIVMNHTIPDYETALHNDMVEFTNLSFEDLPAKIKAHERPSISHLKDSTWEQASQISSKAGLDKYSIFDQFADRVQRDGQPQSLDGAFLAYLRTASKNQSDQRGFNF